MIHDWLWLCDGRLVSRQLHGGVRSAGRVDTSDERCTVARTKVRLDAGHPLSTPMRVRMMMHGDRHDSASAWVESSCFACVVWRSTLAVALRARLYSLQTPPPPSDTQYSLVWHPDPPGDSHPPPADPRCALQRSQRTRAPYETNRWHRPKSNPKGERTRRRSDRRRMGRAGGESKPEREHPMRWAEQIKSDQITAARQPMACMRQRSVDLCHSPPNVIR